MMLPKMRRQKREKGDGQKNACERQGPKNAKALAIEIGSEGRCGGQSEGQRSSEGRNPHDEHLPKTFGHSRGGRIGQSGGSQIIAFAL